MDGLLQGPDGGLRVAVLLCIRGTLGNLTIGHRLAFIAVEIRRNPGVFCWPQQDPTQIDLLKNIRQDSGAR
jgi:hypothetical protein